MNSGQELFRTCLEIPKVALLSLLDLDYKKILKIELEIVEDWIKNERCECCKNPKIKNNELSLNCEHLNKEINKKIKKIERGIEIKSNALKFRNLCKSERFRQRIHTIEI